MLKKTDDKVLEELMTRGVAEAIDRASLSKRLRSGKKLRIKLGIDPTSPNLHLGRSVVLLKLRDFQELGHKIVFIVGDFTGVIGDTSDKESERPMLSKDQVKKNMRSYLEQAGKIIDLKKTEVHYNSEWLGTLGYSEIGEQADQFSLAEFISRENIRKRLTAGTRVSLRELLYPLMQGYDSVMVKADIELGGTDQRFNLLAGRTLQTHFEQMPQDILMTNLIPGTDGRKMSSSWGNTINLTDEPNDMYGKVMRIPDELIGVYFEHCTRVPLDQVRSDMAEVKAGKVNPRDVKMRLAVEIVKQFWGKESAQKAGRFFETAFSSKLKGVPRLEELKKTLDIKLIDFASVAGSFPDKLVSLGFCKTRTEAKELMLGKRIKADGIPIVFDKGWSVELKSGSILQIGKYRIIKIK